MVVLIIGNRDAQKEIQNISLDNNFAIPGDPGFPLNQVYMFWIALFVDGVLSC